MVKTMIFTKTEQRIKSVLEEAATLIESINGKQILENEGNIFLPHVDDNTPREEEEEENRLMTLNPLGYKPIKDIDEIHQRNRRKTDDPYIRLTMKNKDYKRWKNNTAERR